MISKDPCPDCPPGKETDEHRDGCPRIGNMGQIGPPWIPGPWYAWCNFRFPGGWPCMGPAGHQDGHHERWTDS